MYLGGVDRYQPEATGERLEEETGDPGVSTHNLAKLLMGDRVVAHVMVRPGRSLIVFNTHECYLALGLAIDCPKKREALTRFVSSIGYGDYDNLLRFYTVLAETNPTYDSELPDAGQPSDCDFASTSNAFAR
jgi:hypothetical protein